MPVVKALEVTVFFSHLGKDYSHSNKSDDFIYFTAVDGYWKG